MAERLARDEVRRRADAWRRARRKEREAMQALAQAVAEAARQGATEAELVRRSGINRVTVRKMMGKDKSRARNGATHALLNGSTQHHESPATI